MAVHYLDCPGCIRVVSGNGNQSPTAADALGVVCSLFGGHTRIDEGPDEPAGHGPDDATGKDRPNGRDEPDAGDGDDCETGQNAKARPDYRPCSGRPAVLVLLQHVMLRNDAPLAEMEDCKRGATT